MGMEDIEMKKFYYEPEMNISTFSAGDVVTTSGNAPKSGAAATQADITALGGASKAEVAYSMLDFQ